MILEWLGGQMGGSKAPCWNTIKKTIRFGYQVEVDGMEGSVFAFTGALERSSVEKCAETAFSKSAPIQVTVARSGDTTNIEADASGETLGEIALWWRDDQVVIAGAPEQIAELRAQTNAGPNACLQALLTLIPDEPIAMARCDAFFSNVLGLPTVGWLLGLTIAEAGMSGKVTVLYASPVEAAAAAKVIATKDFPVRLPEEIGDFIANLPVAVEGSRLQLALELTKSDLDMLSIEEMERLTHEWNNEE